MRHALPSLDWHTRLFLLRPTANNIRETHDARSANDLLEHALSQVSFHTHTPQAPPLYRCFSRWRSAPTKEGAAGGREGGRGVRFRDGLLRSSPTPNGHVVGARHAVPAESPPHADSRGGHCTHPLCTFAAHRVQSCRRRQPSRRLPNQTLLGFTNAFFTICYHRSVPRLARA